MKLRYFVSSLESSDSFREFVSRNPDSFLGIVFCMLDVVNDAVRINLDYVTSDGRLASFETPSMKCTLHEEKVSGSLEGISFDSVTVDVVHLKGLAQKILDDKGVSSPLTSVIAILRGNKWHLTCMDSGLGMTKAVVDASTGEILDSKSGSVMGMMGK